MVHSPTAAASDHLAEVPEASAPPEIAAIYARVRYLTGAPMTALIWRHLATFPGALPAAWQAMGPLYEAGVLQEAAWRTARGSIAIAKADLTAQALAGAGVSDDVIMAFMRILDAYNRVNPVNFVAVRALARRLAAAPPHQPSPSMPAAQSWLPPVAIGALPPMVAVPELAPIDRQMINALNANPLLDRTQLVPSLYRHLPPLGPLIAHIHVALMPRFETGEIQAQVRVTAAALDQEAERCAAFLPALDALGTISGVVETLDRFSLLIPEMVVLGRLLRDGLNRPE
ncbi:MAG: hypothetical protein ACKVP7_18800 [Hyphomicrobiaceae bacterium]